MSYLDWSSSLLFGISATSSITFSINFPKSLHYRNMSISPHTCATFKSLKVKDWILLTAIFTKCEDLTKLQNDLLKRWWWGHTESFIYKYFTHSYYKHNTKQNRSDTFILWCFIEIVKLKSFGDFRRKHHTLQLVVFWCYCQIQNTGLDKTSSWAYF